MAAAPAACACGLAHHGDRHGLLLLVLPLRVAGLEPVAGLIAATALLAGHAGWELGRRAAKRVQADEAQPAPNRQAPHAGCGRAEDGDVGMSLRRRAGRRQGRSRCQPQRRLPVPGRSRRARCVPGSRLPTLARTSLGRYRIDRVIGRGSMGVVYLGQDPMLGRQVAIKTLALGREFAGSELDDAGSASSARPRPPGGCSTATSSRSSTPARNSDLAYIAMEFLKGHDLQRQPQPDKLLPVPVVLRIGARVAEALAYAHSQGVVHRDIKPANVMLDLPTGAVKVTDFGIARVADASRTRTGMVLGTPTLHVARAAGRPARRRPQPTSIRSA